MKIVLKKEEVDSMGYYGKKIQMRYSRIIMAILSLVFVGFFIYFGNRYIFVKNEHKDEIAPVIKINGTYLVYQNSSFDLSEIDYEVSDNQDEEIFGKVLLSNNDTSILGEFKAIVSVTDESGNKAEAPFSYRVVECPIERLETKEDVIKITDDVDSIQVLINKTNYIPFEYVPEDLVLINSNGGGTHYLREEAAVAWDKLIQDAKNDGIEMMVASSYRSYDYQKGLYDNYVAQDPEGAMLYSAYPRSSEHELGLAVDISIDGFLDDELQDTLVGKWMKKHASKYGFILRYPYGKQDFTGYIYESWHYRYVGVEFAQMLEKENITLEEYYLK